MTLERGVTEGWEFIELEGGRVHGWERPDERIVVFVAGGPDSFERALTLYQHPERAAGQAKGRTGAIGLFDQAALTLKWQQEAN